MSSSNPDYNVDETCTSMPTIRRSGSYFLDDKIKAGNSTEKISPSFKVGSYYAEKVPYHMTTDIANFNLIKDLLKDKKDGLCFDFGANQGFYTYYLASLGMQVHAFEINESNFKALQHGAEFNSKDVADRVNLYPVGLGNKNGRFGMLGSDYLGFLRARKGGPIQGVTFDCFAHHMRGTLDLSNVAFVKLDVEGFEIAVLKGAQNSLFRKGQSTIGGMIMEVGPDRWGRASINFSTGVQEMKKLSTHFKKSHVLIRAEGLFSKTCPLSLADGLSDKNPKTIDNNSLYVVEYGEWDSLLKTMEKNQYDCNLWYEN
jgi:methyltransferase, FkbM family